MQLTKTHMRLLAFVGLILLIASVILKLPGLLIPAAAIFIYLSGLKLITSAKSQRQVILALCAIGVAFELTLMGIVATKDIAIIFWGLALVTVLPVLMVFTVPQKITSILNDIDKLTTMSVPDAVFAGFWKRFFACFFDGLILGVAGAILFNLLAAAQSAIFVQSNVLTAWPSLSQKSPLISTGFASGFVGPFEGPNQLLAFIAASTGIAGSSNNLQMGMFITINTMIIIYICCWLYYGLLESSYCQATLGKIILGLRVVDENGKRLSFKQAMLRYFYKLFSFGSLCLGYLYIALSPTKQGLHDLLSRSYVIRLEKK